MAEVTQKFFLSQKLKIDGRLELVRSFPNDIKVYQILRIPDV